MRMFHAGGFTLIEILVALLVLALGISGAAGAQLSALRARHASSLTSQATELASSLADRMRANAVLLRTSDDNPYAQLRYDALEDGAPEASSACFSGHCSAVQMAQFDVDEVRAAVHAGFPGGRILVCRDAAVWDAVRHALTWDCAPHANAPLVIKIGWRGKRADGSAVDGSVAPMVALAVEVLE